MIESLLSTIIILCLHTKKGGSHLMIMSWKVALIIGKLKLEDSIWLKNGVGDWLDKKNWYLRDHAWF
jgi:hypothetical protein